MTTVAVEKETGRPILEGMAGAPPTHVKQFSNENDAKWYISQRYGQLAVDEYEYPEFGAWERAQERGHGG